MIASLFRWLLPDKKLDGALQLIGRDGQHEAVHLAPPHALQQRVELRTDIVDRSRELARVVVEGVAPQHDDALAADIGTDGGHQHEARRLPIGFQTVAVSDAHLFLMEADGALPTADGGFLGVGGSQFEGQAALAAADDVGFVVLTIALVAAVNLRQVVVAALHRPDAVAVVGEGL